MPPASPAATAAGISRAIAERSGTAFPELSAVPAAVRTVATSACSFASCAGPAPRLQVSYCWWQETGRAARAAGRAPADEAAWAPPGGRAGGGGRGQAGPRGHDQQQRADDRDDDGSADEQGLQATAPDAVRDAQDHDQADRPGSGQRGPQPSSGEEHADGAQQREPAQDHVPAGARVSHRYERGPRDGPGLSRPGTASRGQAAGAAARAWVVIRVT